MLKRVFFSIILPLGCLVGAIFILLTINTTYPKAANESIPTIFIHGYRGTDRSLHGMIRRFDQKYDWGTESLTVNVSPDGKISTTGTYNKKKKIHLSTLFLKIIEQRFLNNQCGQKR